MLKRLLINWIDRFERAWSYDASYMRHVARASPVSFVKFAFGTRAADARAAPTEALFAAGLVGTLSEDCGPCVQISVDMAQAYGVKPPVVSAILSGDLAGMGETASLGYRFAKASLARDLEASDALRDEIVACWGDKALVAIGLTLVATRMYPTLKYALGYGKTCSKVVVAGEDQVARRPLAA